MPEPLVTFHNWSLSERGPHLDLDLRPGDWFAVMGRAGSGKSRLLRTTQGEEPTRGRVSVSAKVVSAGLPASRRATPDARARALGKSTPGEISAALSALGLWEDRKEPLTRLPEGLRQAAALLPCLLAPRGSLLLVDQALDLLDPWALPTALEALGEKVASGCAALVATNRPEIAEQIGSLIVLSDGVPRFCGSKSELLARHRPDEVEVHTDDGSSVAVVAEPLCISVRQSQDGLTLTTASGMETAARLLVQGYGRVKAVVVREPTFREALAELF